MTKLMIFFYFDKRFHQLHYQMNDYLTHILGYNLNHPTRKRNPRSTINFTGSFGNTLFGVATQDQIDFNHSCLNFLDSFTEQERKLFNVHASILNVTF